jgi:ribosome biogenesis protein YTM1
MSNEPAEAQVAIQLTTKSSKHPSIPLSRYYVPVSWKRFQLSELLNKVLGYQDQPVPFDFVLFEGKELLRSSLEDVLKTHGISEVSLPLR